MVRRSKSNLLACSLLLLAGCPRGQQAGQPAAREDGTAAPRASVALRVLVVNEPGVAEAINRLRGEWAERSGGELAATAKTWAEIATAKNLDTDAIVFPSRYLGELCVRGWLRPVRASVLESDEFKADDVFPLIRRELIRWGGDVMALPLGLDLETPGNKVHSHSSIGLLIEAAPSITSNEREGKLFDPQTMKPRISDPEFVAALRRFAAASGKNDAPRTGTSRMVPVIGIADRLVAVTTASRNGASAFKLIGWLASAEVSTQLESQGERKLPVRPSLLTSSVWYDPALTATERSEITKTLELELNGDKCFVFPRIPGVDEYMTALDEEVTAAVLGKLAPEVALAKAAERWERITDAHDRAAQRRAYLKHLGISGP